MNRADVEALRGPIDVKQAVIGWLRAMIDKDQRYQRENVVKHAISGLGHLFDERDAQVAQLIEAAAALDERVEREGEGPVARYERIAELFRKETGFMAPGKDEPAACYAGEDRRREREAAWIAWGRGPFDKLRAALAACKGETAP